MQTRGKASSPVRQTTPPSDDNHDTGSAMGRSSSAKRKRGRVNPSQLAFLERAYVKDRSLDAARRKEISDALGMDERQTQVWFQNRRAKAKLHEQRARDSGGDTISAAPLPAGMPSLQELQHLLQEDFPITLVPCSDVLIGSWRRMNTGGIDLLVFLSENQRVLTYYIRSSGIGFKMRIPFDQVISVEYTSEIVPGCDRAALILSQPPTFSREVGSASSHPSSSSRSVGTTWLGASDWTEGAQASMSTRHEIIGPAGQLGNALASLLSAKSVGIRGNTNQIPSAALNISLAPSHFLPSPSPTHSSGTASNSSDSSPPRPGSSLSYLPLLHEDYQKRSHSQSPISHIFPESVFGAHSTSLPTGFDLELDFKTPRTEHPDVADMQPFPIPVSDYGLLPELGVLPSTQNRMLRPASAGYIKTTFDFPHAFSSIHPFTSFSSPSSSLVTPTSSEPRLMDAYSTQNLASYILGTSNDGAFSSFVGNTGPKRGSGSAFDLADPGTSTTIGGSNDSRPPLLHMHSAMAALGGR